MYRSLPSRSLLQASSRPSGLTSSAPRAKKSWPAASAFSSSTTDSAAVSADLPRQWTAYALPSMVRRRYHQPESNTGTESSVSCTRERISANSSSMVSDRVAAQRS